MSVLVEMREEVQVDSGEMTQGEREELQALGFLTASGRLSPSRVLE